MGGAASRSSSEFSEQLLVEGLGESRVVLLRTDWIPFFFMAGIKPLVKFSKRLDIWLIIRHLARYLVRNPASGLA